MQPAVTTTPIIRTPNGLMHALICFKIAPDLDRWSVDDHMDIRFVPKVLNPADEAALALGVRLSTAMADAEATPLNLSALTVGDRSADQTLKTLLALRFDRAIRLSRAADLSFHPSHVAAAIAGFVIADATCDLLLFGRQSGPDDSGTTPFLVAEALGWPCVTGVQGLAPVNGGCIAVQSRTDGGPLDQILHPPLVLVVGDVPGLALPVPTLVDRMQAAKRPITIIDAAEPPDGDNHDGRLVGPVARLNRLRAGVVIDENDIATAIGRLCDDHLLPRLVRR
jgi:electron transfer flavoprotein alpha/beta subunit